MLNYIYFQFAIEHNLVMIFGRMADSGVPRWLTKLCSSVS